MTQATDNHNAPVLRAIQPISIAGVVPADVAPFAPEFRFVAPASLVVDETYQRNLSERSVSLIRRIVAGWDWAAFKPPICVDDDGALHVIDGQHTAIAAAAHPQIETIPVMVIPPSDRVARARAFVAHNANRVQVTPLQIHYAMLAAGDEDALTIAQICERAGARVLKFPPSYGRFKPGDTMAIGALKALLSRRYAAGARRVVQICTEAKMAPISSDALKSVETLLFDPEFCGEIDDPDLVTAIRRHEDAIREAKLFAATHKVPLWRGLATIWFRSCRKKRKA